MELFCFSCRGSKPPELLQQFSALFFFLFCRGFFKTVFFLIRGNISRDWSGQKAEEIILYARLARQTVFSPSSVLVDLTKVHA